MRIASLLASLVPAVAVAASSASANVIIDGSFENQAALQNNPYWLTAGGQQWGAGWSNWGGSSWQANVAGVGAWSGGSIARSEDFAAGWKHARTGNVFGIIQNRSTMSQTFTVTESGVYNVSWFDANRASWRNVDWFGRPNDYNVTVADTLGNSQAVGNYTSVVAGGNSYSSPPGDGWWTTEGKTTWFAKTGTDVTLIAGVTYTLNFNSMSPFYYDEFGNVAGVDDRTTFIDDVSVTLVPGPGALALLGAAGLVGTRRRR